jgi:hypothetical protein
MLAARLLRQRLLAAPSKALAAQRRAPAAISSARAVAMSAAASDDQLLLVCSGSPSHRVAARCRLRRPNADASRAPNAADWPTAGTWRTLLEQQGLPVVTPEEVQDWGRVTFAAIWAPQPGILAKVAPPLA